MKAKRIIVLIAGLSLVSAARADEGTDMDIPPFNQLESIRMGFGEWNGRFSLDGSGSLGREGDLMNFAKAPAGAFSFKDIYNLLIPHLHRNGFNRDTMFVRLNRSDNHPAGRMFLSDKETMRTLMYGLRDKSVPYSSPKLFEELLSRHPLVPGDDPTPFTYDYDDESLEAARHAVWGPPMILDIPFNGGMPKNGVAASPPNPETSAPDNAGKETSAEPAVVDAAQDEGAAQMPPPSRPWLYVGPLALLSAVGTVFWRIRRKR